MREGENERDGVSIHSGFPNPAADKTFSTLDLNQLLIRHATSTYYFRIAGNDWQEAGVFDGDIAIIDRALDPRRSDTIVWWSESDGEFAITTYSKMPKEASCWGVITATIHEFRKVGHDK